MATLKFKNTDGTWKAIPVAKGKKGRPGSAPTVSISVESLTADKSATITQTGTAASTSIKIGIPDGSDGDVTQLYAKGGNRGTLNGYEVPTVTSSNITVNQSSNDGIQVTNASTITVANGMENTSWTKTVHIKDGSAVIELGDSWVWSGGESPTVLPNSVLVCHWSHDIGVANLMEGVLEGIGGTMVSYTNTYGNGPILVLRGCVKDDSIYYAEYLKDGDIVNTIAKGNTNVPLTLKVGDFITVESAQVSSESTNGITFSTKYYTWGGGGFPGLYVESLEHGFTFSVHAMYGGAGD